MTVEPGSEEELDADAEGGVTWSELELETRAALTTQLGPDQARREARWLVEEACGVEGAEFEPVSRELAKRRGVASLDRMVAARRSGQPVQYVLGRWSFRSLDLMVDRRVLIPRPETEVVAGVALAALTDMGLAEPLAVDLGTGSGAIGLALASEHRSVRVVLTDASEDAVAVARANTAGIGRDATRVEVRYGSWFDALDPAVAGHIDLLVSNPPYVADGAVLDASVTEWEPANALFAGPDGRSDLEHIIGAAQPWLSSAGVVVLEMGPEQTAWAASELASAGFGRAEVFDDLAGLARGVIGWKQP